MITEKSVLEALNACSNAIGSRCKECPYEGKEACTTQLMIDSYSLIVRLLRDKE